MDSFFDHLSTPLAHSVLSSDGRFVVMLRALPTEGGTPRYVVEKFDPLDQMQLVQTFALSPARHQHGIISGDC